MRTDFFRARETQKKSSCLTPVDQTVENDHKNRYSRRIVFAAYGFAALSCRRSFYRKCVSIDLKFSACPDAHK